MKGNEVGDSLVGESALVGSRKTAYGSAIDWRGASQDLFWFRGLAGLFRLGITMNEPKSNDSQAAKERSSRAKNRAATRDKDQQPRKKKKKQPTLPPIEEVAANDRDPSHPLAPLPAASPQMALAANMIANPGKQCCFKCHVIIIPRLRDYQLCNKCLKPFHTLCVDPPHKSGELWHCSPECCDETKQGDKEKVHPESCWRRQIVNDPSKAQAVIVRVEDSPLWSSMGHDINIGKIFFFHLIPR